MSTTVTRLYQGHDKALAAAADLKTSGYPAEDVRILTAATADQADVLGDAGIDADDVETVAQLLNAGATLVSVRAPFGSALEAAEVLDRHGPTPYGNATRDRSSELSADARLSLGAWIPVLIRSKSSTVLLKGDSDTRLLRGKSSTRLMSGFSFSRMLGIPELSSGRTTSSKLGLPELTDSRTGRRRR